MSNVPKPQRDQVSLDNLDLGGGCENRQPQHAQDEIGVAQQARRDNVVLRCWEHQLAGQLLTEEPFRVNVGADEAADPARSWCQDAIDAAVCRTNVLARASRPYSQGNRLDNGKGDPRN